ncbi:hypothetical protein J7T55_009492 [Diaporthe amygdali]|uniref:uncharacterized protein n=1 Tax=Phomopsis amygdali TaxID=1214568 RepID=UPI0022FF1B6D|nr:uncharacterized protein J7T55_009492 [Diaporthe amygdali]KAJ0100681.1 hypothetical protein J7T55_009492 [Diaporthe amygdali]
MSVQGLLKSPSICEEKRVPGPRLVAVGRKIESHGIEFTVYGDKRSQARLNGRKRHLRADQWGREIDTQECVFKRRSLLSSDSITSIIYQKSSAARSSVTHGMLGFTREVILINMREALLGVKQEALRADMDHLQ